MSKTMEVIKESAEGLDRRFTVRVSAAELERKLNARLEKMKGRVQLKGFRKGKAPISHLKKVYGRDLMNEIVQEAVNESASKTFSDRNLQPAVPPHPHFHGDMDAVMAGKADLEYDVHGEILPTFDPMDVATLKLKRPTAEVADADLEEALGAVAEQQRAFSPRKAGETAQKGDKLVIDYAGKIAGAAFPGGTGEGEEILLGSGRFIPGFEEQLEGAAAGAELTVKTKFPDDFSSAALKGKDAEFAVKVRAVNAPEPVAVDEALAKKVGFDDLAALRKALRERLDRDLKALSRAHVKRALLDKLDAAHSFELPGGMVDAEFKQIWSQVEGSERDEEDKDKTEEELKKEYRDIAARRVRLGLVLAEIGKRAAVQVPQEQFQRAVQESALRDSQIMRLRGEDVTAQQMLKFYQQNPQALAQIRAPLFEEKVVDYILERAEVTEVKVTKDELMKDPVGEE